MKILLDTHIFLWLITDDDKLDKVLSQEIKNPDNEVFLSVVSIWECVIKYQLGKLDLPKSPEIYLPTKRKQHLIKTLIVDEDTIKHLINLPLLHKDPFDRLLICQALQHDLGFITQDSEILKYPNINSKVYNNRGKIYLQLGEYQQAVDYYNKAIAINPTDTDAYNNRGIAYRNLGKYQEAIQDYTKAITINPQSANTYNNRGVVYYNLKEYQKAIEDFNQAIVINPQDGDAYYNRGNAYCDLGEYQKAIQDYNQVIKINPQSSETYNNRGIAYYNLKEYQKAMEDYNQVIKINPKYVIPYNNRGNVYYDLGIKYQQERNKQEAKKYYHLAIADYDKALSIKPYHKIVLNNRNIVANQLKNL